MVKYEDEDDADFDNVCGKIKMMKKRAISVAVNGSSESYTPALEVYTIFQDRYSGAKCLDLSRYI
jgi:hypothetical protein